MAPRPTILIAACDTYLAGIYGRKFERDGWEVEVVERVKDAEHRAVQVRPAVLMFEADCVADVAKEVRRLKALPTLLKTHIVVLASRAHMHGVRDAMLAGASDYLLVGHFVPQEAVAKMKRLLSL
ncbi:response regulator transcription factor [Candidatus Uhrbacteria bacterium]|nr:response regulator transcription factor [Candidatus Uhrbacteria bacterium]